MPLFDFKCTNEKCSDHDQNVEILCKHGSTQKCKTCEQELIKVIIAPDIPKVPHISWSKWRAGMG